MVVVAPDVRGLDEAEAAHGAESEESDALFLGWLGCVHPWGEDSFRQVIVSLEVLPVRDHEGAGGEQDLQGDLGGLPVPPALRGLLPLVFEVPGGERALRLHSVEHLVQDLGVGLGAPPHVVFHAGPADVHAVQEVPIVLEGYVGGRVSPVLGEVPVLVCELVEEFFVVAAEPGPEGDVVGPLYDAYGVYLDAAEGSDGLEDVLLPDRLPAGSEALLLDHEPPGGLPGDLHCALCFALCFKESMRRLGV